ncbi:hypothetical protein Goari_014622 [Gossypium aridum]|uniref:RNase H type-1 domain-containing protein n=1 Tax=Gossypium aridum TaxID=34290 RepID=A0A7J8XJX9_GOSAI|nr:hypothetical protein [Gossypium aridum]
MISRNPPPSSWVKVNVDAGFLATKQYNAHEGNSVAYALVKEGMKRLEDHFGVEDAPMTAKELADSDHRFQQLP